MAENPYAAPKSRVEDAPHTLPDGDFLGEGRSVPAGNGWRWIVDAWAFMSGRRLLFIGLLLLMWLVQIAANLVPFVGGFASSFLAIFMISGLILGCDALRRGQSLEVAHLFAGFERHTNKLLILWAICVAMSLVLVMVMMLIVGSSTVAMLFAGAPPDPEQLAGMGLLLILAFLVTLALSMPMTMALLFAPPLIVLHDVEPLTAIKVSFMVCLKNVLPFLVWSVAALILWIVSSIALFVGWVIVGSVLYVSLYLSYRDVFHEV